MFTRNPLFTSLAFLVFGAVAGCSVTPIEKQRLGETISVADLALVDYTVMPDGAGLPEGFGTAAIGASVYAQNCVACHGADGAEGINDRLVGGHGTLTSDQPIRTVGSYWPYATTLFDYVRRAMPYQAPGSLSNDETYAVTAYILYLNDIVEEDTAMNAQTLPEIKMPNRDNVVWDYR